MRNLVVLLGMFAITPIACQKSPPATVTPEPSGEPQTAAPESEPGAPEVPWADKTFKQRQEYMGLFVMPKMKSIFAAHDPAAFGSIKCQTCHGEDMEAEKFEMPNEGIYPLSPTDPITGAMEYDAEITKFMKEQVVPEMAALLGEPVISAEHPDGFGCMSCHPAA